MVNSLSFANLSANLHRRSFSCCGKRFQIRADRLLDAALDIITWSVEKAVLFLGPILICFASVIIGGLSWTFFTILLPMISHKHHGNLWIVGAHIGMVLFLLVEICFNYYMCVRTSNNGPKYDQVVRELALATNFDYPETPQQIERFLRDFETRMSIRVQRRHQKSQQQQQQQESVRPLVESVSTDTEGDVKNRKGGTSSNKVVSPRITTKNPPPSAQQVRDWMVMAPDEWGYCSKSKQPKPPRAHYDHVSRNLILCLDHYCPWMFNAIGYFNYRYFCNFLWFVQLAMIYGAAISFEPFRNTSGPLYKQQLQEYRNTGQWKHIHPMVPINRERMPVSLAFMLCLAVGIAVACLGGFHLYLCLTAQTTIEFHGNFGNRRKAKRLNKKWQNPYSLGWKRNFQQVFGASMPAWKAILIPSRREPEFLPLPMPDGKRSNYRIKSVANQTTNGTDMGTNDGSSIV